MLLDLPYLPAASCAGHPEPDLWTSDDSENNAQAKLICNECPEVRKCLDHAVHHPEYGVWGGLTQRERSFYRRRYQIVMSTSPETYGDQAKYTA